MGWLQSVQLRRSLRPCASLCLRSLHQLCVIETLVQKQAITSWLW